MAQSYGILNANEVNGILAVRNYVANPQASFNTAGWATYKDAAQSTPVDGTGGSPTLTLTRTVTNPILGVAAFLATTTAANLQGEGFSYDFSIDRADQGKVLRISFDYQVISGTYADGDYAVYIYDTTNGQLIQPAGFSILNTGTFGKQIATFQTAINSRNYRLIVHRAVSTSSASTVQFDNFYVGPQLVSYGSTITDWVSWTPTGSWSTNTTYTGAYRRIGDSIEGWVKISLAGAPTAATLTVNLPSGLSIDTSKNDNDTEAWTIGVNNIFDTSAGANYFGTVRTNTATTSIQPIFGQVAGAGTRLDGNVVNATSPVTFASGDEIHITFEVPISGWSSNVVMSNDTDTRVVAARYTTASAGSYGSGASTRIDFGTKVYDTHNAVTTGASWVYTVQVPGIYRVSSAIVTDANTSTSGSAQLQVQKNGSVAATLCFQAKPSADVSSRHALNGSTTISVVAGDTLAFFFNNNTGATRTLDTDANENYVDIERLTGPSAIAASESILCHAQKAAGNHTSSGSEQDVGTWTTVIDTHGAFNATTGLFTVPAPGVYEICGSVLMTANSTGSRYVLSRKNSTNLALAQNSTTLSGTIDLDLILPGAFTRCVAGDTLNLRYFQNSGGNLAYQTGANTVITIKRVGL